MSAKPDFFLPIPVLRKVFRGKFVAGLKRLRQRGKLCRTGPARLLAEDKQFAKLLRRLHLRRWVIYAKALFGGPMQVLRYLGRYTHRVAISNHRLIAFDGEQVSFRWKDYAHGSAQKVMTVAATEFLRRFFLHVLPKGFVRIRHFGFLANRFRTQSLALCRQLLVVVAPAIAAATEPNPTWHCPHCGCANGSAAGIHGCGTCSAMSCPRLFLTPNDICDHMACSTHARALVCLHTAATRFRITASQPFRCRSDSKIYAT
jgi:hypothetical protein